MRCSICNRPAKTHLCSYHSKNYIWDTSIRGFRLKKRGRGSRYNKNKFHATETRLARIVESIFGKTNVCVSFYPEWAKSPKGVLYEFDILVKDRNLLIGYNGEQHYKFVKFFHKTRAKSYHQQVRDKVKRQVASTNGYTLVEFKYTEPIIKDYIANKLDSLCT